MFYPYSTEKKVVPLKVHLFHTVESSFRIKVPIHLCLLAKQCLHWSVMVPNCKLQDAE